jgi:hypothetical protein
LRIFAALSVGVEINFLNASLLIQSRLRVPDFRPQLNFAKFLHDNAAPTTNTRRNGPQSTVKPSQVGLEGPILLGGVLENRCGFSR